MSRDPWVLLRAARFTVGYVRLVGQEPAPRKCVLMSTSRLVCYLATRVRLVIANLVFIFALPLDFHGRLRVVRSMFIPGALHGIEASFLAEASLRKLRAAIVRVVWSRRQSLANPGAVLSLLDGGFVFVCSVGFLLIGQVRLPGFIGFWTLLLQDALAAVLLTCSLIVPLRLVLFGLLRWVGG